MMAKTFIFFLRLYVTTGINFFFRKWDSKMMDPSITEGPVIFAPNHQNAFMDALAIVISQPRISYYLTQAKVFQSKIGAAFFTFIYMKPIYRERDGMHTVKRNKAIIDSCVDELVKGDHPLTIFPEGNHNLRRSLRPLQKGIARIAFNVLDKDPNSKLRIVPVGINYSAHKKFRSDMHILYGEPILVSEFYELYKENNNQGYLKLLEAIEEKMRPLIIDIPRGLKYHAVNKKYIPNANGSNNLSADFKNNQKLVQTIVDEKEIPTPKRTDTPKLIKIIASPLWLVMFINNFLGFKLVATLTKKLAQDPAFVSSMNLVFGIFVMPWIFLIQGMILHLLIPEVPVWAYLTGLFVGNWMLFKVYFNKPVIE